MSLTVQRTRYSPSRSNVATAQGLFFETLAPGISRSGIAMVGGMLRGFSREDAARFSFLLATPVILAAGALKLGDLNNYWVVLNGRDYAENGGTSFSLTASGTGATFCSSDPKQDLTDPDRLSAGAAGSGGDRGTQLQTGATSGGTGAASPQGTTGAARAQLRWCSRAKRVAALREETPSLP